MDVEPTNDVGQQILSVLTKKKEAKWPEWDGRAESLRSYLFELKVKKEEDRPLLGTNRSICLKMLSTLPKDKKCQVDSWFENGGDDGKYDWVKFLDHFKELFEDKQALLTAGKELIRLKQGVRQPFYQFVRQFELKIAQCGGEKWDSLMKIVHLNNSLNEELEKALIGIDLPPLDNYYQWRDKVSEVAGRLESYQARPLETRTPIGPLNLSHSSAGKTTSRDADGDILMTGVNALLTMLNKSNTSNDVGALLAGLGNLPHNRSKDNRPRAPWRSQQDFLKLVSDGVCTRCAKSGHLSKDCPTFRSALRPKVDLNSTMISKNDNSDLGKGNP